MKPGVVQEARPREVSATGRQLSIAFVAPPFTGSRRRIDKRRSSILPAFCYRRSAPTSGSVTMASAEALPVAVLKRKAVVYVRQSTQAQVQTNLESQRRQYELVDVARRWGFQQV